MESKAWRDHFGSVRGGPVRRQRRDKEETRKTRGQEDRRKGKKGGGRGELRGGASPAGVAHLPCYHTKGDTIRVGLKDGGKRENAPLSPVRTAGAEANRDKFGAVSWTGEAGVNGLHAAPGRR